MMPAIFVVCTPGWRSPAEVVRARYAAGDDPKPPNGFAAIGRQRWMAMAQARASEGGFSHKFLLTLGAAGVASAAAVGVLYAVHAGQDGSGRSAELTVLGDGLSAEERRELTRQMLKARRENPEIPAQVRPTPSSRAPITSSADAAPADAPAAAGAAAAPSGAGVAPGAKVRLAVGTAPGQGPFARGAARNRPDAPMQPAALPAAASPTASSAAGNQPGLAAASAAPATAAPVASPRAALPPVVVSTPGVTPPPGLILGEPNALAQAGGDPAAEPERRGFAASVFSTISGFAGTAANATGNTVNWVIDLPAKAISVGGKLLGGDSPPAERPPAAQPAPNRS